MSNRRNVSLLLLVNFLNVFGWALLTPLYALYATTLGASPQAITFSWAFYTLLAGLLTIVFGFMEDHIAKKPGLLTIGYFLQTSGLVILFFAEDVTLLMAGLGVYAIGVGIIMPIWKLLYARSEQKGKEATEWGLFHGCNTLFISAAAAISGVILTFAGFKGIIGLMIAAHFLAMLFASRLKK